MYKFLTDNDLIYNWQFGFRSQYSTQHALVSLTEGIKTYLDNGYVTAGIFLDLRKAFDTVNHQILLDKLLWYGFRCNSHKLLQSFLSNRRQYVSINGYESEKCEVKCGIPRGSTLGPLLFLIYINDLRFCLHITAVSHFADDTCITYSSKDLKSLKKVINSDLREVMEWLNSNRLSLNVKMSKLLLFQSKQSKIDLSSFSVSLSGTKMTPENDVKYLGMQIDNNL